MLGDRLPLWTAFGKKLGLGDTWKARNGQSLEYTVLYGAVGPTWRSGRGVILVDWMFSMEKGTSCSWKARTDQEDHLDRITPLFSLLGRPHLDPTLSYNRLKTKHLIYYICLKRAS